MDVLTSAQRKFCMSKIRGKNTQPERKFREILKRLKVRYTLNSKLPGKPDFKIIGHKVVIFIDGCFWHGCPQHFNQPKNNSTFWAKKITGNKVRDFEVTGRLRQKGYGVIRIWEHDLRDMGKIELRFAKLIKKYTISK